MVFQLWLTINANVCNFDVSDGVRDVKYCETWNSMMKIVKSAKEIVAFSICVSYSCFFSNFKFVTLPASSSKLCISPFNLL